MHNHVMVFWSSWKSKHRINLAKVSRDPGLFLICSHLTSHKGQTAVCFPLVISMKRPVDLITQSASMVTFNGRLLGGEPQRNGSNCSGNQDPPNPPPAIASTFGAVFSSSLPSLRLSSLHMLATNRKSSSLEHAALALYSSSLAHLPTEPETRAN